MGWGTEGNLVVKKIHKLCILPDGPLQRNVLVRNATRSIHSLWIFLTTRFPSVTIIVYYLESSKNISDMCSKLQANPVESTNSSTWRHGLQEWKDASFPPKQDRYLEIKNGQITWVGPAALQNNFCSCGKTICQANQ